MPTGTFRGQVGTVINRVEVKLLAAGSTMPRGAASSGVFEQPAVRRPPLVPTGASVLLELPASMSPADIRTESLYDPMSIPATWPTSIADLAPSGVSGVAAGRGTGPLINWSA